MLERGQRVHRKNRDNVERDLLLGNGSLDYRFSAMAVYMYAQVELIQFLCQTQGGTVDYHSRHTPGTLRGAHVPVMWYASSTVIDLSNSIAVYAVSQMMRLRAKTMPVPKT